MALVLGGFLFELSSLASAEPQTGGGWGKCIDLVVYVDISKSMTGGGGKSYKKAMQDLRDLTKDGKPLWLGQCVDLEVSFFGKGIAGSRGPFRINRLTKDRKESNEVERFMKELEQQGLSYGEDVTNYTDMVAVMEKIRLRATDSDIPRRAKRMFLVYSDFAHNPEEGGGAEDISAIQRLLAEEFEGENGLLWEGFDDPNKLLFLGHVFAARNPDDAKRQINFVGGFDSLKRKGIHFLNNPSLSELESIISESIAPLSLEARRATDNRGWYVDIRNMEELQFSDLKMGIDCDTELSSGKGASHRKQVTSISRTEIAPGELLENQRVDDPFLLPGAPSPERLVKCIFEVFGRSSAMEEKDRVSLGSTTLFHGVFIDLDLDYVRPEFDFLAPGKPTAQVILKLRGQIFGGERDCDNIRLDLLVSRGDGAVSILKRDELTNETKKVTLSEARRRAGEDDEESCSIHPQKWKVFIVKLDLGKTAREVPLCGHKPPPLIFRVVARGGATAQDDDIWRRRFDEEIFPKRDGDQQGHELTREIILPICLSALLAGLLLKLRRTWITLDDFINALAFVLILAGSLYAILHEYTLVAKSIENFVASQGPVIAIFLALCILVLVYCGWRWGIFGLEPSREMTRSRLLKKDLRKAVRSRVYLRFIPLAVVLVVGYALYLA